MALKVTSVRFLLLCMALTTCILAQHPSPANAAACPTVQCGTIINACLQVCPEDFHLNQIGTCTDAGGKSHNEFVAGCICFEGECYE